MRRIWGLLEGLTAACNVWGDFLSEMRPSSRPRMPVQHALERGYEVVGVCRGQSVGKLDAFKVRITIVPGATDDPEVIERAVAGCGGVLVVLVPRGVHGYSSGTA